MKLMLYVALYFAVIFAVLHALGLREHTGFLSGTVSDYWPLGLAYQLAWIAFIVVAPVLAIATPVTWILGRLGADVTDS